METIDRRYYGRRREKIMNAINGIMAFILIISCAFIITGYVWKDIINRDIMYLVAFISACLFNITQAIKAKMLLETGRMLGLILAAMFFLGLSVVQIMIMF